MSPSLKVGCVGAGYFSRFHYDAWARIEGAEPVASVNRNIAGARATGLAAYGAGEAEGNHLPEAVLHRPA